MKNLKLETMKKLESLLNNKTYNVDKYYCDIINTCIDYDNEAQDSLYLYDTIHEYYNVIDDEILEAYIKEQLNYGVSRIKYIFAGVTQDNENYILDDCGNLQDLSIDDCLDMISIAYDKLKNSLESDGE